MTKLKCIIIDDEPNSVNFLRSFIKKKYHYIEIVAVADNIFTAYELINKYSVDFVLLDIQMPKGNGFELLNLFSKIDFEIIFVTSYNQYALSAIKISAIDYILKPIDEHEFDSAMEKVMLKLQQKQMLSNKLLNPMNYLIYNLNHAGLEKKIIIHHDNKVEVIRLKDLVCIIGERNYSNLYLKDGNVFLHYKNLKEFEDIFKEFRIFMRINRSSIINLNEIVTYSKNEPTIIKLSNGFEFQIPRRRKAEITQILKNNSYNSNEYSKDHI